ncbi:hypothetical protein [Hyphomonas sp.]|uniref:hypothetical protein n=1 Tax=Hyphomonas sp. TaxID=87 RepID=UPI00391B40AA
MAALRTGQPQMVSYSDPGSTRTKTIQVSDVTQVSNPLAGPADSERLCYTMKTTLSVSDSNRNEVLNPTYCDDGQGGFEQVR